MAVAYQYCTGAVHAYVHQEQSFPGYKASIDDLANKSSLARYVGTCEQYPMVGGGQNWNPWFADQTGCMEPADWEYMNEWKIVGLDFSKFSQMTMDFILKRSESTTNTSVSKQFVPNDLGVYRTLAIGSLLKANSLFFMLWLKFENYGTPAAVPNLPPGEFYPCCRLVDPSYKSMGTKNRVTSLVFRTMPLLKLEGNTTDIYSTETKFFTSLKPPDTAT